jgi:hypothetical protein
MGAVRVRVGFRVRMEQPVASYWAKLNAPYAFAL